MKQEELFEILADVPDEHILEAKKRRKKHTWPRWAAMAACLCLTAGGVFAFMRYHAEHRWPVRFEASTPESTTETDEIPRWEDMPLCQQYNELTFGGFHYNSRGVELPENRIGTPLAVITAQGWDEHAAMAGEDGSRYLDAEVCAITDVSPDFAVAVRYEGTDAWYTFATYEYIPETLGQFLQDSNLREEIVFRRASYSYRKPSGSYATVYFENVAEEQIWELLLSHTEAVNEYAYLPQDPKDILSVGIDVPLFGLQNIVLTVCEDGYITTNILAYGNRFRIGTEFTEAFVDYVLNECQGYEIVHIYDPFAAGTPE